MNILKYYYPEIKKALFNISDKISLNNKLDNTFWEWYTFYNESETWDTTKIKEFQINQLKNTLSKIYNSSKYYNKKWDGIEIDKIKTIDDFTKIIPKIDRNEYRKNYNSILSDNYKNETLLKASTSGTTGNALQFYHTFEDKWREWAAICHQWKRVGYDPLKSKRVEFRGLTPNGRIINYYPTKNMFRCSILQLDRNHLKKYAEEINKYKMDYYHGYPSAIYLLAKKNIQEKINFPQPKAILLASEQIYEWQINTIKEAFNNVKIFAHYGCAERTVLGAWCEYENSYHIMPHYSIVEIDKNTGEIIGTNLFNTVNSFVRYKMTDSVLSYKDKICEKCNRPYLPIIDNIGGRKEDYLYSLKNGWIPPAIVTYPLKNLKFVKELQIVQEKEDEILLLYTIFNKKFNEKIDNEKRMIIDGLKIIIGDKTNFEFKEVADFKRNSSGKFKWIVSNLKQEFHY